MATLLERIKDFTNYSEITAATFYNSEGHDAFRREIEDPDCYITPDIVNLAIQAIEACNDKIDYVDLDGYSQEVTISVDISLSNMLQKDHVSLIAGISGDCIIGDWEENGVTFTAVCLVED